ncbi:MAG TPA: hypothetical protein VD695_01150 [Gaiellaceae bacterium]|nr:hypothetical protein [Gaiellaceae bacterium]
MSGRRWLTWLVVGGLATIAVAAAVDALREEPAVVRTEAVTPTVPGLGEGLSEAVTQLREAGVSGVLTYSDEDCRLHAVSLPDLEPARAPSFQMCRPSTSTGELGVLAGDVVWSGLGYGAVQVVLPRARLSRAILGEPAGLGEAAGAAARFHAVQAVTLDDERLLVLAESTTREGDRVLAVFDGPDAEFAHLTWWAGGARAVRPSPQGGYFALIRGEPGGVRVFTRDGRAVPLPGDVPLALGLAWSPDERWTAVATHTSLYLFRTEQPHDGVIRVPLAVRDLDWSTSGLSGSP